MTRLRVVNAWGPSYQEARSAVGAADVLAQSEVYPTLADALEDCSLVVGTTAAQNRELQQPMHDLRTGAAQIASHLVSGNAALLFGSEKTGLSKQDFTHCHWLLHIPTREDHVSMNLGQAVAVCLYQLRMELPGAQTRDEGVLELAPAEDLERITALLLQGLIASEYVKSGMQASVEEKLRLLLRRLNFTPEDAALLTGMLRKMVWKLQHRQE